MSTTPWWLLVISLPTESATVRMRVWRALKSLGCGVLRDGAYLLPQRGDAWTAFQQQAEELRRAGGVAYLLEVNSPNSQEAKGLEKLFDRAKDYAKLIHELFALKSCLDTANHGSTVRRLNQLKREFHSISAIDFFPSEAREQAKNILEQVEMSVLALISPGEPNPALCKIKRLNAKNYQKRLWATRKYLWVDRLASAWLIKRFIDPNANFLWLDNPADCPRNAIGFDFDGAAFTHIGAQVTFEVLMASFALDHNMGLSRLGTVIHYLDVGGIPAKDADGLETILQGAKQRCKGDDALLSEASRIFDCIYTAYSEEHQHE